jgi:hypothetical protein
VVCGGPNDAVIREETIRANVGHKFEFCGHVDNVAAMLSSFDIFGYPLAPDHYGTGEQSLIEAIAAGVPPVVLANGAEQHVVEDGITGIVATNEEHYTRSLELLYRDPVLRKLLAENGRKRARERFTIEKLARSWSALYHEAMESPKRTRKWPHGFKGERANGAQLFVASMGEHGADFAESMHDDGSRKTLEADERIANKEGLFRAKTRGSVFHYQSFFPDDPYLNLWCGLILKAGGSETEARHHFSVTEQLLTTERVAKHMETSGSPIRPLR